VSGESFWFFQPVETMLSNNEVLKVKRPRDRTCLSFLGWDKQLIPLCVKSEKNKQERKLQSQAKQKTIRHSTHENETRTGKMIQLYRDRQENLIPFCWLTGRYGGEEHGWPWDAVYYRGELPLEIIPIGGLRPKQGWLRTQAAPKKKYRQDN